MAARVLVIASPLFYPDTSIGCLQGSAAMPSRIAQIHLDKGNVDVSNLRTVCPSLGYASGKTELHHRIVTDDSRRVTGEPAVIRAGNEDLQPKNL